MKRLTWAMALTASVCVTLPSLAATKATFKAPPRVRRTAEGWLIAFEASAAADVAVAILDAKGRVVRHLAAGVLGPNAPAPLARNSLAQSLVWDGKTDYGQPAAAPFRARVGVGLKTTPAGGQILWPPHAKIAKNYTPWPGATEANAGPKFYGHLVGNKIGELASNGVLWARTGFAPAVVGAGARCNCLAANFDVDPYGRVFYPEGLRCRVAILDTNGNLIARFGRYGNRDESAGGRTVPLTFPIAVAATDDYIYVGDIMAGRLMRVKIGYQASAEVELQEP